MSRAMPVFLGLFFPPSRLLRDIQHLTEDAHIVLSTSAACTAPHGRGVNTQRWTGSEGREVGSRGLTRTLQA